MAQRQSIQATTRTVIGKDTKKLRRNGEVPGVVYGPVVEDPISVTVLKIVRWANFTPIIREFHPAEDLPGQNFQNEHAVNFATDWKLPDMGQRYINGTTNKLQKPLAITCEPTTCGN